MQPGADFNRSRLTLLLGSYEIGLLEAAMGAVRRVDHLLDRGEDPGVLALEALDLHLARPLVEEGLEALPVYRGHHVVVQGRDDLGALLLARPDDAHLPAPLLHGRDRRRSGLRRGGVGGLLDRRLLDLEGRLDGRSDLRLDWSGRL